VHTAVTCKAAVRAAEEHEIDVVVLDLGLPDLDGTEVITALRAFTTVPIIVLSARADSGDKVRSLDRGADDYVTKPFGVDELMARLRAAVRRAATVPENGPIDAGELTIDLAAKIIRRSGEEVHLTPTEWSLLDLLVRNRGRLVGRKQLLREVWGPVERKETSYLRVYMAQLRRKLERDPAHPEHLITEAGMGYRFRP
jgi:two-component system KDP operon response regulator KdpE